MAKQQQLQLPYEPIQDIATVGFVRDTFKRSGNIFSIPIDNIVIREGFNARIKPDYLSEKEWEDILDIPLLAKLIYQNNGPTESLEGDVTKSGQFIVTEGERRTRAIRLLIAEGKTTYPNGDDIASVRCILNPPKTDELQRALRLHNQEKMPLTTMQKARLYARYADVFKLTHEQIAEMVGVSRQTVDNHVLMTKMDEDVIRQIECGTLNQTNALNDYRKQLKEEKQKEKQQKIVQVDKNSGEVIDPKDDDDSEDGTDNDGESPVINNSDNTGNGNQEPVTNPTVVETKMAEDAEMKSRQTSASTTNQLDRKLREEEKEVTNSMSIDFKQDKEEGDMILNEIRKNNDKIYAIVQKLPDNVKQSAADILQLIDWQYPKIDLVQEILKKAADKR